MNKSKESKIKAVIDDMMKGMSGIYMKMAVDMGELSTTELKQQFAKLGYEYNKKRENAVSSVLSKYAKDLDKGGTMCVERTVNNLGNGKVSIGSERKFVPWLKDFKKDITKNVLDVIKSDAKEGVHPSLTRDKLKPIFDGTKHRAMTASRTEAQKIRSDIRSQRYVEQGIKYVQWITARDGRVRPDHEARDGLIYAHENAPMMGEYNCRCVLAPADRIVENGAYVQPSPSIMMPESVLADESYALPPRIDIDTKEVVEELPKNITVNPFSENGVSDKAVSSYKEALTDDVSSVLDNYLIPHEVERDVKYYMMFSKEKNFLSYGLDRYKDRLDDNTFSRLKSGEILSESELKEGFTKGYQKVMNDSLNEYNVNTSHVSKEELLKISTKDDIVKEVGEKWGSRTLKAPENDTFKVKNLFGYVDYKIDGVNDMDKAYLVNNLVSADKFVNDIKYPFPLSNIGSNHEVRMAYACYTPSKNSINFLINCDDYSKVKEKYLKDVADGFHPKYTTADNIFTHELGHAYVDSIQQKIPLSLDAYSDPYWRKRETNAEDLCFIIIKNAVDILLSRKLPNTSKLFTKQDQLELENYVSKMSERHKKIVSKPFSELTEEEKNIKTHIKLSKEISNDFPLENCFILEHYLGFYSTRYFNEAVAESISREYTSVPDAPPNVFSKLVVGLLKTYIMSKGKLLSRDIVKESMK